MERFFSSRPWILPTLGALALLVSLGGCADENDSSSVVSGLRAISPEATTRALEVGESTVSYAEATEWLTELDASDHRDQIRDWAVLGLASLVDIDVEAFRDYAYDKSPVRDPLFADLVDDRLGPGRSLADGSGLLHLLVPQDDPHPQRTIGLLLDDRRKDTETDPEYVQVHRYRINEEQLKVVLRTEPQQPTDRVRRVNGYREGSIDDTAALAAFLEGLDHLASVEVRGDRLQAAGWSWPDSTPAGEITLADLAVLRRGYLGAALGRNREPGFSLDPGPPLVVTKDISLFLEARGFEDVARVAEEIENLLSTVEKNAVLASDEVELAAIQQRFEDDLSQLTQRHPGLGAILEELPWTGSIYQHARYEGGLEGTEAGMTYFYTDLVAKAWPMELGSGSPAGRVPGFVSNIDARTPWGHCGPAEASGRLWFGLRDEGVAPRTRRIDLGPLTTRLFSLIDDPEHPGEEIEPPYDFGRIMWWWDRHYQAMADYEPQYHRLDQLMRWGAALSWLADRDDLALLPVPAGADRSSDLAFDAWIEAHPELRWSYQIPWVRPEGVETEALLTLRSDAYDDCGGTGFFWSGGVTSPRLERVHSLRRQAPRVDRRVARAGLDRSHTDYSAATRSGTLGNAAIRRTLSAPERGGAQVSVEAAGRNVWSFAALKAWVDQTAPRVLRLDMRAVSGRLRQRLSVQGLEVGELSVEPGVRTATVRWRAGVLGRARRALASLQDRLPSRRLTRAATEVEGASLAYVDPAGTRAFLRLDGSGETRWIAVEEGLPTAGEEMAFRLGAPGGETGPTWYGARFSEPPRLSGSDQGGGGWFTASRGGGNQGGDGSRPLRVAVDDPPREQAERLSARIAGEERNGRLYIERNRATAAVDDPIFGLAGSPEGGALLDSGSRSRILAAQREARDGYARAVSVGDSLALADGTGVTFVRPSHPWHRRVHDALAVADGRSVRVTMDGADALLVGQPRVTRVERVGDTMGLGDFLAEVGEQGSLTRPRGPPLYLERRFAKIIEESTVPAATPERSLRVRVVEVGVGDGGGTPPADLLRWDGGEWRPPSGTAGAAGVGPKRWPQVIHLAFLASDCEEDDDLERCA